MSFVAALYSYSVYFKAIALCDVGRRYDV